LRLHDLDHGPHAWTIAAGLPIYISLFGRDTLTACWQAAILGPEMMKGTLQELAGWQGTTDNPWRDEQPGKMLHEAHTGPLAWLRFNPRDRYYGAITTSAFYPVIVSELWHWTGDKDLIAPLVEPALRAIKWLDTYADLRGDGFHYYLSRSRQGNRHQAWKDSAGAVVYENGAQVAPPSRPVKNKALLMQPSCSFPRCFGGLIAKMKPNGCIAKLTNSRNASTTASGCMIVALSLSGSIHLARRSPRLPPTPVTALRQVFSIPNW
jgi:hypothetical protein